VGSNNCDHGPTPSWRPPKPRASSKLHTAAELAPDATAYPEGTVAGPKLTNLPDRHTARATTSHSVGHTRPHALHNCTPKLWAETNLGPMEGTAACSITGKVWSSHRSERYRRADSKDECRTNDPSSHPLVFLKNWKFNNNRGMKWRDTREYVRKARLYTLQQPSGIPLRGYL
jgi:hypothetical protein